jgi:DNA invertase Pin-like site-specific DNA recombinase
MLRIAIYSRKSIETDTGESIKNQIQICKSYFKRENGKCKFEIFEDEGFSGGNIKRPDFQRMMQLIKIKQFDVVAVYKVDRIARNIVDFVNVFDKLEKLGVKLVSVTEGFDPSTPIGKMMMMLLASFAEMERMNTIQRVKDNMCELAKMGRWSGGTPPTGYVVEKVKEGAKNVTYLKLNIEQGNDIKEIFQKYINGYTPLEISRLFKSKGKEYKFYTIYSMLRNPTYLKSTKESIKYLENQGYTVYGSPNGCGFLPYNRRPRKNGIKGWKDKSMLVGVSKHEAVIDLDAWVSVQEKFKIKASNPRPRESQFSFLTGGIMKCTCGSGLEVTVSRPRVDGTRRYYFKCRGNRYKENNCSNKSIRVERAEKAVIDFLESIYDKDVLIKYVNKNKKKCNVDESIKEIKNKLSVNKKSIDSLVEKLILLSDDAAKIIADKINKLTEQNVLLKEELIKLERKHAFNELDNFNIDVLYNSIKKFLQARSLADRKRLIKIIINKIVWNSVTQELHITLNI